MDKGTTSHQARLSVTMLRQRYKQSVETFNQLPLRMRQVLILISVLLAVLLIIYGLLLPAQHFADEMARQYRQSHSLLAWMQANESKARALKQTEQAQEKVVKDSLLSTLADTAQRQQISFKRFEPREGNELRVWLENIPFNKLILWLDSLQRLHGIDTKQITISRRNRPGLVNAVIVLKVN